jgi:hypothetical protein
MTRTVRIPLDADHDLARAIAEDTAENPQYDSFLDYLNNSGTNFLYANFDSARYMQIPDGDLPIVADLVSYDCSLRLIDSARVKGGPDLVYRYVGDYRGEKYEVIKIGMRNGDPKVPARILFRKVDKVQGVVASTRSKLVR